MAVSSLRSKIEASRKKRLECDDASDDDHSDRHDSNVHDNRDASSELSSLDSNNEETNAQVDDKDSGNDGDVLEHRVTDYMSKKADSTATADGVGHDVTVAVTTIAEKPESGSASARERLEKIEEFTAKSALTRGMQRAIEEPSLAHKSRPLIGKVRSSSITGAEQSEDSGTTPITIRSEACIPAQMEEEGLTLIQAAMEAIKFKQSKTNRFRAHLGDVMIVLDTANLSKSLIFDSGTLERKAPAFVDEHFQSIVSTAGNSNGKIKFLFVLEKGTGAAQPKLTRSALNTPAPVGGISQASESTTLADVGKIKTEPSDKDESVNTMDWIKVYEVFLRVTILGTQRAEQLGVSKAATVSLPMLEQIVAFAERWHILHPFKDAFLFFCSAWQTEGTLWSAVAQEPMRWLKLSAKLEYKLVYKESFVHVVGHIPKLDWTGLDAATLEMLQSEADAVRIMRYSTDRRLQDMTITVSPAGNKKKPQPARAVDHINDAVSWLVVSHWRDWFQQHLSFVDPVEPLDAESGDPRSTVLCKHKQGDECLTLAGLYRVIGKGGDAYLPAEEVVAETWWNVGDFSHDETVIRQSLATLKARASEIVKPLLESRLQYADKDSLPYLTCADAGNVPWVSDDADGEEDIDMNG